MKILFIQPSHNYFQLCPPLGLGYLTSYLLSKQPAHQISILDLAVERVNLVDHLQTLRPDLIGINCSTPSLTNFISTVQVCRNTLPKTPIVVGGPHVTAVREEIFKYPVDVAVVSEGEEAFFEVVQAYENKFSWDEIKGIIFKQGEIHTSSPRKYIESIDSIPFPARHLYKMDRYNTPGAIISSRGCPFQCIFCSQTFGRTWRGHSAKYVISEIQEMVERHGLRSLRFMDDNPFVKKDRMIEICDLIIDRGLFKKINIDFNSGIRADLIDDELLIKMKKASVKTVYIGLESADENVLKGIKKGVTAEQVKEAVNLCKKHHIFVEIFVTIGMPNDSFEANKRTIDFAKKMNVDLVIPAIAMPYPGTPLFDWVDKSGRWLNKDYSTWWGHMDVGLSVPFDTPDFPAEQRIEAYRLWWQFYLRKNLKNALRHPLKVFSFAVKNPKAIPDTIKRTRAYVGMKLRSSK
ncbi:MAG: radical SAM protein [Candidatus Bathyarchaeota archaeon]